MKRTSTAIPEISLDWCHIINSFPSEKHGYDIANAVFVFVDIMERLTKKVAAWFQAIYSFQQTDDVDHYIYVRIHPRYATFSTEVCQCPMRRTQPWPTVRV
ncbi:hypothetical protein HRR77_004980 [Exophiala dermatitidis]|nr:hypothetical protein HRR77_004980 [Exophiala dermatitidis]